MCGCCSRSARSRRSTRPCSRTRRAATSAWSPGIAVALFADATLRYWLLYRRRPAVVLISVLTTWALLAEAAAATAIGRPWQLSWWLWHVLLVLAFAFVAYTAHVQYRREGTAGPLFRGVAFEETVLESRAGYEHALEQLVAVMHDRHPTRARSRGSARRWPSNSTSRRPSRRCSSEPRSHSNANARPPASSPVSSK